MRLLLTVFLCFPFFCEAKVITQLPTKEKVVAVTFDACQTKTPASFDSSIVSYVMKEKLPCTIFVSGKFADGNRKELIELSSQDFIEIENHSFNHYQHMEKLNQYEIQNEVLANQRLIKGLIQKKTRFFRFPAGNYDSKTLSIVESLGYKVVHWSFESGDPDPKLTTDKLYRRVIDKTKPGGILIFHVNGRGVHTGEALPLIVRKLRSEGYRFVKLSDVL